MSRFAALVSDRSVRRRIHSFRRAFAAVLVAPLAFAAVAASASAQTQFEVNPSQSTVHFGLADTLHAFGGVFQISSANFSFDRKTGKMSGEIIVAAASGNSGTAARDRKMKKEELKVKKYPDITFQPASFTGEIPASGTGQIKVSGTFTLLGKPHPLTVPMTVVVSGTDCTATGTFEVPYIEWGLKDPSMLFIHMQKQVKIDLKLVGQLKPAA